MCNSRIDIQISLDTADNPIKLYETISRNTKSRVSRFPAGIS